MTVRVRGGRFMLDIRHQHSDGRVERIRIAVPQDKQSRRGAEAYERTVLADLRAGVDPRRDAPADAGAPTIAAWCASYLRLREGDALKPSTLVAIEQLLRTWVVPVVGHRPLDAVRTGDYSALRVAMLASVTAKTTNNGLAVLSTMVRRWHAEHDRPRPTGAVGLAKVPKDKAIPFYGFADYELLVSAAPDPVSRAVVLLAGDAGLRMSEIRALCWGDVRGDRITVARSRDRDAELATKGNRPRVVPMTKRLREALHEIPRSLRDAHVVRGDDGPLTRKQVRVRLQQAQRRAGLAPHGRIHALRHTFCSHLAMRGAPARTIQELAGHSELSTTMRYMHLVPGAQDEAIRLLEAGHTLGTAGTKVAKTGL